MPKLKELADQIPDEEYSFLERPPRYEIKTVPRRKPERVKPQIVRERGFKTIHLLEEMIAEFDYRPVACKPNYRVIVLRKRLGIDKGQTAAVRGVSLLLLHHQRPRPPAEEIVFSANDRCDQENLIAQLKERRARADDAGGRPGEQLGVHGDGGVGLEPEGVECLDGAGIAAARGRA